MADSTLTIEVVNRTVWKLKVLSVVVAFLNLFQSKKQSGKIAINIHVGIV